MIHHPKPTAHRARTIGRTVAAMVTAVATMLVGLIFLGAAPAGAHHPEGSLGSAECRGVDDVLTPATDAAQVVKVAYTAAPWYSASADNTALAHPDVGIQVSINGGAYQTITQYFVDEASITPANGAIAGDEVIYTTGGVFEPVQDHLVFPTLVKQGGVNRAHSQGGYFLVESDDVVTSIAGQIVTNGPWANGSAGGQVQDLGTLRPQYLDCTPPPVEAPAASSTWECGSDITVTLDNTASDIALPFVVDGGAPVMVAAGSTQDVILDAPVEDGAPVVVTVTVDGNEVHSAEYTANCYAPVVTSTWECGSDIVITLDNTASQLPAAFEIDGAAVAVNTGLSMDFDYTGPVEDGEAVDVSVLFLGEEIHAATYGPSNCLDPSATSAWDCGTDITVTLDNTASHLPAEFVVNGVSVTVPAGETDTVVLEAPAEDGDAVAVSVTVDGEEIHASAAGPADCVDNDVVCDGEAESAVDVDGDGIDDACEPVCDEGNQPSDSDQDGVADTCPEVLDNVVVTPAAQPTATGALAYTGSDPVGVAIGGAFLLLLGLGLALVGRELADA